MTNLISNISSEAIKANVDDDVQRVTDRLAKIIFNVVSEREQQTEFNLDPDPFASLSKASSTVIRRPQLYTAALRSQYDKGMVAGSRYDYGKVAGSREANVVNHSVSVEETDRKLYELSRAVAVNQFYSFEHS